MFSKAFIALSVFCKSIRSPECIYSVNLNAIINDSSHTICSHSNQIIEALYLKITWVYYIVFQVNTPKLLPISHRLKTDCLKGEFSEEILLFTSFAIFVLGQGNDPIKLFHRQRMSISGNVKERIFTLVPVQETAKCFMKYPFN